MSIVKPLADLLEALEISGVAAVKNRAPVRLDDESAEAAMRIVQHPRAPMMARRERDLQRPEFDASASSRSS